MFKPGDLIITLDHLCNAQVSPMSYLSQPSEDCVEPGSIGMIIEMKRTLDYGRTYYRVLFGEHHILNVWPWFFMKKYEG